MPRKQVIITGYGPFGKVKLNPSWEAVRKLPDEYNEFQVTKLFLQVSYQDVIETVPKLLEQLNPTLVIHCGVGSSDGFIKLEQTAHCNGYTTPDIK